MSSAYDRSSAKRALLRHRNVLVDELEQTEAMLRELEEIGELERPKYLTESVSIRRQISLTDRKTGRPRRKQPVCKTCWSVAERLTEQCPVCKLEPKAGP